MKKIIVYTALSLITSTGLADQCCTATAGDQTTSQTVSSDSNSNDTRTLLCKQIGAYTAGSYKDVSRAAGGRVQYYTKGQANPNCSVSCTQSACDSDTTNTSQNSNAFMNDNAYIQGGRVTT